jgi:cytochrome c5
MRKKALKWTAITLGSFLVLLGIFYAVAYQQTESRANKVYTVNQQTLTIPTDSASYQLGKHIAEIRACMDCHAPNFGGKVFLDEKTPMGVLYASNLTTGKGGIQYTDQDWVRALRHGLNKANKPLWFMPSMELTSHLSNTEMGALIYFLKSQPPVDQLHPAKELKPLGRILTFLGQFPLFPAELIDHNAKPVDKIEVAVNSTYGGYLATTCMGCHGIKLKGGPSHGENAPPIPDISSTGKLGKWTAEGFVSTIRTGKTPEGVLLSDAMPWKSFSKSYTDTELKALYTYMHESK